ncbi:MAG TPA: hypothetical protein VFH58_16795 [Acidimicrobiales bacterium]|nr:hypothetical protein [Acidimicrobiales bacterium]
MRNHQRVFFSAAALMAGTLTLALPAATAWAAGNGGGTSAAKGANQPPGNNGTVKIDEYSMDPGQDNDPHVSCDFSVSFYGYDGGPQTASLTVTPVAPTSGGHSYSTSTSWNVGTRTSGSQFDRNVTISASELAPALAGVSPQAQQGYHLRLEVEVTGSQGSDDKYKVFWLQPCGPVNSPGSDTTTSTTSSTTVARDVTPPTTLPTRGTSGGGNDSPPTTTAVTVPAAVAASQQAASQQAATSTAQSAGVTRTGGSTPLGSDIPAATSSRAVALGQGNRAGGSLAFTGSNVAGMSAAGLGLIGAGTLLTLRSRRKGRPPVQD